MSHDDTLRERLADAAGADTFVVPAGSALRRSATRHRTQRRVAGGSVVALALAAVAVAGSTLLLPGPSSAPPAGPAPSVSLSPTTAPTPSTAPTLSTAPTPSTDPGSSPGTTGAAEQDAQDALQRAEAQAFVEQLRFEHEPQWQESLDFPPQIDTSVRPLLAHGCDQAVPGEGVLATRTVLVPGAESGSLRQLALFPDATSAAQAFDVLRSAMRACHAAGSGPVEGQPGVEVSFVGGQLALGDESFWVGTRDLVTADGGDGGFAQGDELFYSTAALLVLDANTITVIDDPASSGEMRATFVQEAGAEWEQLQPGYEDVRR